MPGAAEEEMTVFFDIGGVLLRLSPLGAARRMMRAAGWGALRAARKLWSRNLVARIEKGELAPEEIHRLFCKHSGWGGDLEDFARLWTGPFALKPKTADLFARLARTRKVYLLSNTNAMHYDYIKVRYAFARQAAGAVLSHELGCRKPEPRIYREAARLARVEASRCLLIDDRAENVEGARKAGWTGLVYRGNRALKRDLRKLGLL